MASVATKKTLDADNGVLFSFTDGVDLTLEFASLSPEIIHQLALHGAKQKIGDSYSGEKDPAAARALATKTVERLQKGEWTTAREGGGRISDIAEALSRVTGVPIAECVAKLADMDADAKRDLRKHAKVKLALASIALERAQAAADAEEAAPLTL